MLQLIGCCYSESNVAHKVQRYIKLFVAPELASDVLGFIPASSPCGLRSKAGGRTEAFTAEYAKKSFSASPCLPLFPLATLAA
jgi:hypothetical protein